MPTCCSRWRQRSIASPSRSARRVPLAACNQVSSPLGQRIRNRWRSRGVTSAPRLCIRASTWEVRTPCCSGWANRACNVRRCWRFMAALKGMVPGRYGDHPEPTRQRGWMPWGCWRCASACRQVRHHWATTSGVPYQRAPKAPPWATPGSTRHSDPCRQAEATGTRPSPGTASSPLMLR